MGGAAERAGCRQYRKPVRPAGRGRSPKPANGYHSRILSHCYLVLQTRYAFTSAGVPIPVKLGPKRSKKASHSVKRRGASATATFLRGFSAPTWWEPRRQETSMTSKAISLCDSRWKALTLLALAFVLWPGFQAFAAAEPDLIFRRSTLLKWVSPHHKLATYGLDA